MVTIIRSKMLRATTAACRSVHSYVREISQNYRQQMTRMIWQWTTISHTLASATPRDNRVYECCMKRTWQKSPNIHASCLLLYKTLIGLVWLESASTTVVRIQTASREITYKRQLEMTVHTTMYVNRQRPQRRSPSKLQCVTDKTDRQTDSYHTVYALYKQYASRTHIHTAIPSNIINTLMLPAAANAAYTITHTCRCYSTETW